MGLVKCPECCDMISNEARICPHCGYPIKEKEELNIAGKIIDKYQLQINGRVIDVMNLYLRCNKKINLLYKEIMYATNCTMNAAKDLAYDFKESFDLNDIAINEYLWAIKVIRNNQFGNNILYINSYDSGLKKDINNIYDTEENLRYDIKKIKFRVSILYIFYIVIPIIFTILSIIVVNSFKRSVYNKVEENRKANQEIIDSINDINISTYEFPIENPTDSVVGSNTSTPWH